MDAIREVPSTVAEVPMSVETFAAFWSAIGLPGPEETVTVEITTARPGADPSMTINGVPVGVYEMAGFQDSIDAIRG